ncbi:hypothetical protein [Chenggangzhangella methanolivorans]|uniref:Multi-ubiquitin domain-containing protein n=1 Tax=Chenggangzhangella methanolivorans TaxID=1437009 RepID=A0A9E6R953_9HYPH|nr:hypothetical protein [Chenggangzhangella methanolivorans]QZN99108.1 hypothetical protein K6K41_19995 [Chenggangzhangella methanolivorans]
MPSNDPHSGSGGKPDPKPDPKPKFQIKIDRTVYEVREETLSAERLRTLPDPDIGPDRDLFQVVPGGSDLKITADAIVTMAHGLRFFTAPAQINPG